MSEKPPLIPQIDHHVSPRPRRPGFSVGSAGLALLTLALLTLGFRDGFQLPTFPNGGHKHKPGHHRPHHREVCLTPSCVHAASDLLYSLSPDYQELDACTDFEELVCGGWRERHELRDDQGDAFTGTLMEENSALLLKGILEAGYPKTSAHSPFSPARLIEAAAKSADEENFDKMKAAYGACVDEKAIKAAGVGPLMAVLKQIEQAFGWVGPAPDGLGRYSAPAAFRNTMLLLATSGVSALVSPGTGADDKDPDTVIVSVSPPWTVGLPSKERYDDDKLVAKYEEVAAKTMGALYHTDQSKVAEGVVKLERLLAAASPSTEESEDVTKYYNPYTLEEAAKLVPQIDLAGLLLDLADGRPISEKIIVASPAYMVKLSEIISETPPSVMQNFFLWKAIQSFAPYIEANEMKPLSRFNNELAGKDPDSVPERWRTCLRHVDSGVGWILSRFFVEKAFSAKAKKFGDTIVSDIKDQFAVKLKHTDWMPKKVVTKALDKVHNIVQKIGYPTQSPDIMDPKDLGKYYRELNLTSSDFFANAIYMRQVAIRREWHALGKPVDRNEWGMTASTVNAYYNPPGNEIVFPAGIMQLPVFDVNVPAYVSYGAFGSVAGHELSHAFDSTGRHYDQNGNYTDWWTNSTVEAFTERANCFVDQYHNYTVDGPDGEQLHVNGRLTLGENIADAGGLSASFQAWKGQGGGGGSKRGGCAGRHRRRRKAPEQDLPGLDFFTHDQLFFVSYASWWCGKSRPATAVNRIYIDPHAPKWARVLGTMANSREFREAFACEQREPVCELW